jgi:excisionase family DNA binding protein
MLQYDQMKTSMTDETFTLSEIARILKLSYFKVYRMARSGELRTARFGNAYRVTRAELSRQLGEGPTLIQP